MRLTRDREREKAEIRECLGRFADRIDESVVKVVNTYGINFGVAARVLGLDTAGVREIYRHVERRRRMA